MTRMGQIKIVSIIASVVMLTYLLFVNRVESGEVGLAWNSITGEMTVQTPGVYFTSPVTTVAVLDTKSMRFCVPSTAHAAINCKLVEFDPTQYEAFVATEGWSYYWFRNRLSFNSGYSTERGFRDVMRGYAFSSQRYPFIRILNKI